MALEREPGPCAPAQELKHEASRFSRERKLSAPTRTGPLAGPQPRFVPVGQTTPERSHHRPTGIGKSYLCCALLEKACREGYTAYYAQAHKLFRELAAAYVDGSYDRFLSRLARTDVLAIDDWALLPLAEPERRHLFEVVEDRHGSRSTLVASQFPVENWHELIGSPSIADALIDRVIQGAHRIALQGETMRDPAVAAQMQELGGQSLMQKSSTANSPSARDKKEGGL